MTTTTTPKKPLLDEDLERMFSLIEGADSVELKLTVPESDQRSTVVALGIDPLDAELRQVYFFDTPDLALNKKGVVVRARRVQRKGGDSVVKLRPIVPSELPDEIRQSPSLGVEVDAEGWTWRGRRYPFLEACRDRTVYQWTGEDFEPVQRFTAQGRGQLGREDGVEQPVELLRGIVHGCSCRLSRSWSGAVPTLGGANWCRRTRGAGGGSRAPAGRPEGTEGS